MSLSLFLWDKMTRVILDTSKIATAEQWHSCQTGSHLGLCGLSWGFHSSTRTFSLKCAVVAFLLLILKCQVSVDSGNPQNFEKSTSYDSSSTLKSTLANCSLAAGAVGLDSQFTTDFTSEIWHVSNKTGFLMKNKVGRDFNWTVKLWQLVSIYY